MQQLPPDLSAPGRSKNAVETRRRRRFETRPIWLALAGTLFVHLAIFLFAPSEFGFAGLRSVGKQQNLSDSLKSADLDIFLTPEPEEPKPQRFVEVNPDVAQNKPERTENFASRDQQAAQEKPRDEKSELPEVKGEKGEFTAVVSGRPLTEKQIQEAIEPQEAPVAQQPAKPPQVIQFGKQNTVEETTPLPGFEKAQGDNKDGIGFDISSVPPAPNIGEKTEKGEREGTVIMYDANGQPKAARPVPRPRPRIQVDRARPIVLREQLSAASNAGTIAVNANFSEYGDYLQELIDTVDAQFQRLVSERRVLPEAGTYVSITFRLSSLGEVTEIISVEETAGKYATYTCLDAIRARAPYRPWTKEMVAVLGLSQEIHFRFHYH